MNLKRWDLSEHRCTPDNDIFSVSAILSLYIIYSNFYTKPPRNHFLTERSSCIVCTRPNVSVSFMLLCNIYFIMKKRFKNFWHGIRFMLQYTKKLNPAVFVPTFFLVILEIAKTFSSILLPQYFIDDITNRSSIRQTMFHLAILIIAIFGIQIFRAAITPYILIIGALFFVILSFCLQLNALKRLFHIFPKNHR